MDTTDDGGRLTDAERDAIKWAVYAAEQWHGHITADTLRAMLRGMSLAAT